MTKEENKIFHYLEIGFYLIFLPLIIWIIPIEKYADKDPKFLFIILVYFTIIHLINRKFNIATSIIKREYIKAAITILALIIITYITTRIETSTFNVLNYPNTDIKRHLDFRFRSILTLLVIDISFNVMLGLILELFRQRSFRQEMESAKNRAEIALYKSQINPHFMFNSLNTLYGLYITNSEKTGEVFLKFTDMIKYTFANTEKDKVMIGDEINYIKEYIDLQRLRLDKQTTVNFNDNLDDETLLIPPMLLIPFVENAFKYGVSSTNESVIDISVCLKKSEFVFTVTNNIFSRNQISTGIGINNCRKRLELLYKDRYVLECKAKENVFSTYLKIEL